MPLDNMDLSSDVRSFAFFIKQKDTGHVFMVEKISKQSDGRIFANSICIYNPDGLGGAMGSELFGLFDSSRFTISSDLSLLFK